MNNKFLVVMYHYVRDLYNSRYPKIRGLDLRLFNEQIEFLKQKYNIIPVEKLISCFEGKDKLPDNSLLLTFDDGYIDHYTNVFPILMKHKIQGSFFVPAKVLNEDKLLDVNKIHFLLASISTDKLISDIFRILNYYRGREYKIESNEILYNKLAIESRFDNKDTIFIKRLLQTELSEALRNLIVDKLFIENINVKESVFAKELYVNYDQIKVMKSCGMHFGIHGYDHYWLGNENNNKFKDDIDKAVNFYGNFLNKDTLTINYPYGSYNDEVLKFVREKEFKLGFTTNVGCNLLSENNNLTIARLDTNDFPPKSNNYLKLYK